MSRARGKRRPAPRAVAKPPSLDVPKKPPPDPWADGYQVVVVTDRMLVGKR